MPHVLNRRTDHIGRDAIYVGRPSKFGNPFATGDRNFDILNYRFWLSEHPEIVEAARNELAGRDLVCWCAPLPCHADVLLEVVTADPQNKESHTP